MKTEQQTTNPASQNDTAKSPAAKQALLSEFLQIAERVRGDFSQDRVFVRMMVLALGMICAMARHTLSQGIVGVGQGQRDWSAWYRLFSRQRVKEEDLAQRLFEETLRDAPQDQPYVTGIDATHIPRSSRKFPGAGWAKSPRGPPWMPALHQAQRFVTCAWFPPLAKGYTRAIVLRLLSAFTPKSAPAGEDKQLDWDVALKFAEWVRQGLDAAGRTGQLVVTLLDGAFDKLGVWRGVRGAGKMRVHRPRRAESGVAAAARTAYRSGSAQAVWPEGTQAPRIPQRTPRLEEEPSRSPGTNL